MCHVTEYSTASTGTYSSDVTEFSKLNTLQKILKKDNKLNRCISSSKLTVFIELKCSLLATDNVCEQISEHIFIPNGGWGIAGITFNKILKAGCIISGCVGKFWSKCRLTVSPFHNPANNSNSLFIPFISAADQGHFSVPMWSATIASITLFVTSWLVSALELLKVFTHTKKEIHR